MTPEIKPGTALWRGALRCLLAWLCLFLPARDLSWAAGWAFFAACAGWTFGNIYLLLRRSPALLRLREEPPPPGAPGWDRGLVSLSFALMGTLLLLCGMEGPARSFGLLNAAGLAGFCAALLLFTSALLANPFAAPMALVQEGQTPADTGPYSAVRHPLYLATALAALCAPAALGATAAFPAAAALAAVTALRTWLEDRLLLRELPGYAHYARRVPYRLLPGIW